MCVVCGLCVVWLVCLGFFLFVGEFVFLFVLMCVCFSGCVSFCLPSLRLVWFPLFECVLRFRFLWCFLVRFLVF